MTETRIESRRIYHIILKLPFWKSNCNFCLLQTGGEQRAWNQIHQTHQQESRPTT